MTDKCKGNIYRYQENAFQNSKGELIWSKRLRRLEKQSCPGCTSMPYCEAYFHDEIGEYISNVDELPGLPEKIRDGDKLKLICSGSDEGIEDMWFEKVEVDSL